MAFKLSKFLIEILCLARYTFGGDNLHSDKEIAVFTAPLDPLSCDPERSIELDTGRNLQVDVAFVDGFNLDRGSKNS